MAQEGKRRLTADDWAVAALDALSEGGLPAVAVEPLATRLGATKGSFYWHFANRDALISATLLRWESVHTDGVIATIEALPDPVTQLRTLLSMVIAAVEHSRIDSSLLAAADHPLVAPVLTRVTGRRIAYVAGLFEKLDFPPDVARGKAVLAYSAYLGHGQLAHATPGVLPGGRAASRYLDDVIAALTAR